MDSDDQPPIRAGPLLPHSVSGSGSSLSLFSPWQESQKQYELEYQRRATNLDKCMAELWRMERARDKNAREMKASSDCRKGSW